MNNHTHLSFLFILVIIILQLVQFSFFFLLKSLNFLYFFEFYVNYFFILAIFRGWVDVFWVLGGMLVGIGLEKS